MTEAEAKERIEKTHCAGNLRCSDNCMQGAEYCEYSMARKALEKQIAKKVTEEKDKFNTPHWYCSVCGCELYGGQTHCDDCGQKLDWSEV